MNLAARFGSKLSGYLNICTSIAHLKIDLNNCDMMHRRPTFGQDREINDRDLLNAHILHNGQRMAHTQNLRNRKDDKVRVKRKLVYISLDIGEHDLNVKKKMIRGYLDRGFYVTVTLKKDRQLERSNADLGHLQSRMLEELIDEYTPCALIKPKKSTDSILQIEPLPKTNPPKTDSPEET